MLLRRPNRTWQRLFTAVIAVVFVLLNTMPVKAVDEYTETWEAKQYRAVKLTVLNPARYIPSKNYQVGSQKVREYYDSTIPDFETQWICLGVAQWEVTFSKDNQTLKEYWGADNDADHWRNYYPTGSIASPGSNWQTRRLKAQFSNVDSCNNTTGYWVEAVWNYKFCLVYRGEELNCRNTGEIGPDSYMLYNIGQYALLGEIGGQTKEGNNTLGANYLYPFNIRSEPIKWNVSGATN